jgi:hypothetical protein
MKDSKQHQTASWLNVSVGTVERSGSDGRCPYSQGLAGYVWPTPVLSIVKTTDFPSFPTFRQS